MVIKKSSIRKTKDRTKLPFAREKKSLKVQEAI